MKTLKIYVAGKMTGHSHFGSHTWRDDFLGEISKLSGVKFISYDPTNATKNYSDSELVFGSDVHMISKIDVMIVYLSDNVGVGTSQEILLAKYFGKPVIALAPIGGIYNGGNVSAAGIVLKNFKHPFVYTTCDVVCDDIEGVAKAVQDLDKIKPKTLSLIDKAFKKFESKHLEGSLYETRIIDQSKPDNS
jgi:hypothetical protein